MIDLVIMVISQQPNSNSERGKRNCHQKDKQTMYSMCTQILIVSCTIEYSIYFIGIPRCIHRDFTHNAIYNDQPEKIYISMKFPT